MYLGEKFGTLGPQMPQEVQKTIIASHKLLVAPVHPPIMTIFNSSSIIKLQSSYAGMHVFVLCILNYVSLTLLPLDH